MVAKHASEGPLVSVVLPTYDRPDRLLEAVRSVEAQTYPSVELIVVDDASPRPAAEVIAEAGPPELEWRCLRHDRNRGANAARNTGIRASKGEILAFLDDDDRWRPEKLEAQVGAFREGGERVGVVVVGQRLVDGEGTEITVRLPDVEGDATADLIGNGIGGPFSTIAVRRPVVEQAGLTDERFPVWQDREWLIRLSQCGEFAAIRKPLVRRCIGEHEQIGDRFELKRDVSYPLFVEKHRDLAAAYGREGLFVANLATGIAASSLASGAYADARRFAATAIARFPYLHEPYVYLLLSLGGRRTYRFAYRAKQWMRRLSRVDSRRVDRSMLDALSVVTRSAARLFRG